MNVLGPVLGLVALGVLFVAEILHQDRLECRRVVDAIRAERMFVTVEIFADTGPFLETMSHAAGELIRATSRIIDALRGRRARNRRHPALPRPAPGATVKRLAAWFRRVTSAGKVFGRMSHRREYSSWGSE